MDKKTLLINLKRDFDEAKKSATARNNLIQKWKKEYQGDLYGNETQNKNRSRIVSRLIKKIAEWLIPGLVEPFVSTPNIIRASGVTYEDVEPARRIELLLNTQFCRQFNRFTFINKAVRLLNVEGTCVVRTGWETVEEVIEDNIIEEVVNPAVLEAKSVLEQLQINGSEEEIEEVSRYIQQLSPTIKRVKTLTRKVKTKNHPTAVLCRNEDIFIDPTVCDNFEDAQFIIHRYETDLTTLKQAGLYENLDDIKIEEGEDNLTLDGYTSNNSSDFKFVDKARKKLLVYEYWGNYDIDGDGIAEPIVCAWVGDVIIRLEPNPYPDKKLPFIVVPFSPLPFNIYGESNAELLSEFQKVQTAILRGFIDNLASSTNGQIGIPKNMLDTVNKTRFLNGDNFEYNMMYSPRDYVFQNSFRELPGSVMGMMNMLNAEAEAVTGVKSFSQGLTSNSLGGTNLGIQGVLDSSSTRRLNLVRNISENLIKPLLRKWLAYNAVWLDEETQIRITNDDFVLLKRDDLGANIDIELTISTSDDNKATANELAFLLQTLGQSENPEIRKLIMAEICDLYKRPELARQIKEFTPQPDPIQQKLQQLEIELLAAKVANERAKGAENEADVSLKTAKTEHEYAKARNVNSKSDNNDLNFINNYNGTRHKQDMEKLREKNDFELNKNIIKALENSVNNNNL